MKIQTSLAASRTAIDAASGPGLSSGDATKMTEREAFQAAVAGTFYKMMLKSLHQMHDKPAYFHGGQAEEIFRNQMDQYLAEDFARTHGAPLTDALYEASVRNRIRPVGAPAKSGAASATAGASPAMATASAGESSGA